MLRSTPWIISASVLQTLAILYWLGLTAALTCGSIFLAHRFLGVTVWPAEPGISGTTHDPIVWGEWAGGATLFILYAAWQYIGQVGYGGPPLWGRLEITLKLILTLVLTYGLSIACWLLMARVPQIPFPSRFYITLLLGVVTASTAVGVLFPEYLPDLADDLDDEERGSELLDQESAWQRMQEA